MSGVRERKKEAARLALHEAAVRLMSEQGPENVTVDAIAQAASMSRRTFSNYFANKEEAVFYRDLLRSRLLLELVRERPASEGALTALRAALDVFTDSLEYDAEQSAQRRIVMQRPSFAAQRTQAQMATERELSAELLRRLPDRPRARLTADVLATTSMSMLRIAREHWLEDQSVPLRSLVAEAMEHLRE